MSEKLLIVDGYNMIAFWESTKQAFRKGDLDDARTILLNHLSNYASFEQLEIICVFDAHHVPGLRQRYDDFQVTVIFTAEDETADSYIERLSAEYKTTRKVVSVATSDLNEQWVIFSQGALRVSARELEDRVTKNKQSLDRLVDQRTLYTPRLGSLSGEQLQELQALMDTL